MRGWGAGMTREGAYVAGGCVAGGVHRRGACVGACMPETRLLKRVVRILLERFLVENSFSLIR